MNNQNIAKTLVKQGDQSLSFDQKEKNVQEFLPNMRNELFKIFENSFGEIQIDNSGRINFVIEIDEDTDISKEHIRVTEKRQHKYTKLDAIDGEATFVYLMNPILEYLGFNSRFYLDDRSYKNMGDNGDFKFGAKRLDIKTRQVKSNSFRQKTNLLVNEFTVDKNFNFYGLVHREGDHDLLGKQRRCTFVGTATHEEVTKNKPISISSKSNYGKKYEVNQDNLDSLNNLITDVCLEILYRGGVSP